MPAKMKRSRCAFRMFWVGSAGHLFPSMGKKRAEAGQWLRLFEKIWRQPTLAEAIQPLPSARLCLTAEFGMGSGRTTALWPPKKHMQPVKGRGQGPPGPHTPIAANSKNRRPASRTEPVFSENCTQEPLGHYSSRVKSPSSSEEEKKQSSRTTN